MHKHVFKVLSISSLMLMPAIGFAQPDTSIRGLASRHGVHEPHQHRKQHQFNIDYRRNGLGIQFGIGDKVGRHDRRVSQKHAGRFQQPVVFEVFTVVTRYDTRIDELRRLGYRQESSAIDRVRQQRDTYLIARHSCIKSEIEKTVHSLRAACRLKPADSPEVIHYQRKLTRLKELEQRVCRLKRQQSIDELMRQIHFNEKKRQFKEALSLIDTLLKLDANHREALACRARIQLACQKMNLRSDRYDYQINQRGCDNSRQVATSNRYGRYGHRSYGHDRYEWRNRGQGYHSR